MTLGLKSILRLITNEKKARVFPLDKFFERSLMIVGDIRWVS
jgi:hypothetical protein